MLNIAMPRRDGGTLWIRLNECGHLCGGGNTNRLTGLIQGVTLRRTQCCVCLRQTDGLSRYPCAICRPLVTP